MWGSRGDAWFRIIRTQIAPASVIYPIGARANRSGSSIRNVRTTRETSQLPDSDRIVKVLGLRHYGFFATYENPRLIDSLTCETFIVTRRMKSIRMLELLKLNEDSWSYKRFKGIKIKLSGKKERKNRREIIIEINTIFFFNTTSFYLLITLKMIHNTCLS